MLGYLFLARLLYDSQGLFLLTVPVLVAFIGSSGSALGLDYVLERREKLKTRRTLERYVSKNLVKDILDNPASFYSTMKGARIPGDGALFRSDRVHDLKRTRRSGRAR